MSRWLIATYRSIWSKKTAITLLLSFAVAETIWWKLFGFKTAWQQALENMVPAFAVAITTFFSIAITQIGKVRELMISEGNELKRLAEEQGDEAERVSVWLSGHFVKADIGIREAYLFGSVTHKYYQTNDVDIALVFKGMNVKDYAKKERRLRLLVKEFERTFGKNLHVQRFLASESDKFLDFIGKQSEPILIMGGVDNE